MSVNKIKQYHLADNSPNQICRIKLRMVKNLFVLTILLGLFYCSLGQSIQRNFQHNGLNRIYRIYVPANYDANKPVPLVIAFHGLGDHASNFQNIGFKQLADQDTFIVIYPQGIVDQTFNATAWNAGVGAFGYYLNGNIQDVDFISAVIDSLSIEFSIDVNRIYATGYSIGGYMAQRLACELPARFAAIASVSGLIGVGVNCSPGQPVAVLHMHGTDDSTITYGGEFNVPGSGYTKVGLSVDEMVSKWMSVNKCTATVVVDTMPDLANDNLTIVRFTRQVCEDDSEVILYKIINGEHIWLSGSQNDIDATITIWEFFKKHAKSSGTVGIKTEHYNDNIQVYPNPAKNSLFIKVHDPVDQVILFNQLGQQIITIENPGDLNIELSLERIPSGMYWLIIFKDEINHSLKILKQ